MSEATFTVDGLTRRPRQAKPGLSVMARITILLGVVFVLVLALVLLVWMKSEARADQAVKGIVSEARQYRQKLEAESAALSGKKKKKGKSGVAAVPVSVASGDVPVAKVREDNENLKDKLDGYTPKGVYIIVDTANNRFTMKDGSKILLDTDCATGSYAKLSAPDGRSWFFHTPRGQFKIKGKITNPVWVKPDWAFVEDGKPIPKANDPDRYDPNVMGDYALPFGNGYFIHGTLYPRLIKYGVTHGCIRLADVPLKQVYDTATVGTPVFIY